MHPENRQPVSSCQTVLNSIGDDTDTLNWFSYVLWHPDIKGSLNANGQFQRDYKTLAHIETGDAILCALILVCLFAFMRTRSLLFIGAALLLFILRSALSRNKITRVIKLSSAFLEKNFTPSELSRKTLYHLTETLSQKYNTASLVDTIYFQENFSRILGISLFLLFISPLTLARLTDALFALFLALITAKFFINHRWVYRLSQNAGII